MKNCSLSGGRAAQVGLGLEHQQRRPDVGDVAQRRLAPELVDALRASTGRRGATPGRIPDRCPSWPSPLTWFVTPFSETAALNRSVVPTSQLTMNPP